MFQSPSRSTIVSLLKNTVSRMTDLSDRGAKIDGIYLRFR